MNIWLNKKKKQSPGNCGIAVRCEALSSGYKKEKSLGLLVLWALGSLLLISAGGVALTMLHLSVYSAALGIWSVACLGLCFCFCEKPRYRLGLLIGGAVFLFVIFLFGSLVRDGLAIALNAVKDLLGTTFRLIYLPSAVSGNSDGVLAVTVFLMPITLFAAVFVTYMIRSHGHFLIIFALMFFMAALMVAKTSPNWLCYALLALSVFLLMIARGSGIAFGSGSGKALVFAGIVSALLLLALCALPLTGIFTQGGAKPAILSEVENSFQRFAEDVRWGTDTTNNLPEGRLEKTEPLQMSEDEALEVTMSRPESLYLRGYVGTVYTSEGWQAVDNVTLYRYADLFYWLHDGGFYGTSQLSTAADLVGAVSEEVTVSIRNLNAKSKYIYTPYEYKSSCLGKSAGRIGDDAPSAGDYEDSREITYTALSNQVKTAAELGQKLQNLAVAGDSDVVEYLTAEKAYRDYVYDTSLQIPESLLSVLKTHFGEVDISNGHVGYDEAMQGILDELLGNMTYNEDVSASADEDFCRAFLENEGEGYSVHYATAAALIFRYYGIPARYVEGYIITPENARGVDANEPMVLTGKNAHAWVEYYRDGVGWIPFEVTPPYLFVMEQPNQIKSFVSDTLDTESNQQGMVEMEEDNYEDLEPEETDTEPQKPTPAGLYVLLVGGLFLLLLLSALFALWLWRRIVLRKRKKDVTAADHRLAVDLLFRDALTLFAAGGVKVGNGSLAQNADVFMDIGEKNLAMIFQMMMEMHRETIFSDHMISPYRRYVFLLFHHEAVGFAKTHSRPWKRWRDQYIHHLY